MGMSPPRVSTAVPPDVHGCHGQWGPAQNDDCQVGARQAGGSPAHHEVKTVEVDRGVADWDSNGD